MEFDIKPVILAWLQENRPSLGAVEVLDYGEETEYGGYCETCSYEEIVVQITYKDSKGKTQKFRHYDNFAEFVKSL
jgi:hypothetical protein